MICVERANSRFVPMSPFYNTMDCSLFDSFWQNNGADVSVSIYWVTRHTFHSFFQDYGKLREKNERITKVGHEEKQ